MLVLVALAVVVMGGGRVRGVVKVMVVWSTGGGC